MLQLSLRCRCNFLPISLRGVERINDRAVQLCRKQPRRATGWLLWRRVWQPWGEEAEYGGSGTWRVCTWLWVLGWLSCQCLFYRAAKTETGHFADSRNERSIYEQQFSLKFCSRRTFRKALLSIGAHGKGGLFWFKSNLCNTVWLPVTQPHELWRCNHLGKICLLMLNDTSGTHQTRH